MQALTGQVQFDGGDKMIMYLKVTQVISTQYKQGPKKTKKNQHYRFGKKESEGQVNPRHGGFIDSAARKWFCRSAGAKETKQSTGW